MFGAAGVEVIVSIITAADIEYLKTIGDWNCTSSPPGMAEAVGVLNGEGSEGWDSQK